MRHINSGQTRGESQRQAAQKRGQAGQQGRAPGHEGAENPEHEVEGQGQRAGQTAAGQAPEKKEQRPEHARLGQFEHGKRRRTPLFVTPGQPAQPSQSQGAAKGENRQALGREEAQSRKQRQQRGQDEREINTQSPNLGARRGGVRLASFVHDSISARAAI